MAVVTDIIEAASMSHTGDGLTATREFIVSELTGPASAKLHRALNTPGIPQRLKLHETIPVLVVDSREATTIGADTVRITVGYKMPNLVAPEGSPPNQNINAIPNIRVGSTIQEVETERDVNGNPIVVTHIYIENDPIAGTSTKRSVTAIASVAYRIPMTTIEFLREEKRSPGDKSAAFVGRVNRKSVFGDPPRFWLCTAITGDSQDGGSTYMVSYAFQRSIANINDLTEGFGTWDPYVRFVDPDTGRSPVGLVKGEGLKQVKVLPDADFERMLI